MWRWFLKNCSRLTAYVLWRLHPLFVSFIRLNLSVESSILLIKRICSAKPSSWSWRWALVVRPPAPERAACLLRSAFRFCGDAAFSWGTPGNRRRGAAADSPGTESPNQSPTDFGARHILPAHLPVSIRCGPEDSMTPLAREGASGFRAGWHATLAGTFAWARTWGTEGACRLRLLLLLRFPCVRCYVKSAVRNQAVCRGCGVCIYGDPVCGIKLDARGLPARGCSTASPGTVFSNQSPAALENVYSQAYE